MGEQRQSEGREANAAVPVDDYPTGKGMADREGQIADSESPERLRQADDIESTGRTAQVAGEDKSFLDVGGGQHQNMEEALMMREPQDARADADPNDLTGPAGDPAEGPRDNAPS